MFYHNQLSFFGHKSFSNRPSPNFSPGCPRAPMVYYRHSPQIKYLQTNIKWHYYFFQSTNEKFYANLDYFLLLHIQCAQSTHSINSLMPLKSIPSFSFPLTALKPRPSSHPTEAIIISSGFPEPTRL